jgi:hypothetical protein
MNTKLSLTIDQEIIQKAKVYAKNKNRSLSDIIENYLKILTKEEKAKDFKKLNPIVKSLKGSFKIPKNIDYKKELKKPIGRKILIMDNVLTDTDVLLDFFFNREPFSKFATEVLTAAKQKK